MDNIRELVKNPLDSDDTIMKLLNFYALGGEYSYLVGIGYKADNTKVNRVFQDELDSLIFNQLRENIMNGSYINLTELELQDIILSGNNKGNSLTKGFHNYLFLRAYLRDVGKVNTTEEVYDAIYNPDPYLLSKYDGVLSKVDIENSLKAILPKQTTSREINSSIITGQNDSYQGIDSKDHCLYLNLSRCDIHRTAVLFIEKCQRKNLPYNFTLNLENRSDSIIIYTTTLLLNEYVNILKEIEEENEDIVERSYEKPILSGKIDNWISYGEAPDDDKNLSYGQLRTTPIREAITTEYGNWLSNHLNENIVGTKEKLTPAKYISIKTGEKYIEKELNDLEEAYSNDYISLEEYKKSLEMYKSSAYQEEIFDYIHNVLIQIYSPKGYKPTDENTSYIVDILYENIRLFILKVPEIDNTFIPCIKDIITEYLSKEGIDSDNICFNKKETIHMEETVKESPFQFLKKRIKRKK